MPFSLKDLTWQVVEWNEVCDLLGGLILDYDGVHHFITWHQVVSKLLLRHLEGDLVSFLLFLVESIYLGDVFCLHHSWISDEDNFLEAVNLGSLVISCHWLLGWECCEPSLHIFLRVQRSMEIWSLREWMRDNLTWCILCLPNVAEIYPSCDLLDQDRRQLFLPELLMNTQVVDLCHLHCLLLNLSLDGSTRDESQQFAVRSWLYS